MHITYAFPLAKAISLIACLSPVRGRSLFICNRSLFLTHVCQQQNLWEMTEEDHERNDEIVTRFVEEEEAKGMGGMLWRSELNRRLDHMPDPKKDAKGYEHEFFRLLDEVPFRGDPDLSEYPPGRGVGENVNQTRRLQEEVQDELIDAVCHGRCEEIRRLSTHVLFKIDMRDYVLPLDAPTPLGYAIHYEQTQAALLLIELGADLNKVDRCGASPLHYCAGKNSYVVAQKLLEMGADPNVFDKTTGATPLHIAAMSGNNEVIKVLCEGGALVNLPDQIN